MHYKKGFMKYLITTIATVMLVGTAFADPLHDAASNGDLAGLQAELDKGVDVDEGDDSWPEMTPLHYAVGEGHTKVVELLIANGANVNAKNNWKGTPLDIATNPENPIDTAETADLLRKHGGKTGEELKAEGK